jgi:hypothetical protein
MSNADASRQNLQDPAISAGSGSRFCREASPTPWFVTGEPHRVPFPVD